MGTSEPSNANSIGYYADILLDDWFKRSFKEYGNAKQLLKLFIEALIPERKITSLEYSSEESINQNPDMKGVRVDVECTDENGERFVVEVQRAPQDYFFDRAVFNSTFAIQRQLVSGDKRYKFSPVYFIGILRFTLHHKDPGYLYTYSLREDKQGHLMTDDLHYIFLEVKKCRDRKDASYVEKIGYALANMGTFERRPEGFAGEFFDLLFNSADIANFAPEEKQKYLNDMTTERDIHNQIEYARNEGVEKGREEGREEGIEEGIEKGREEGKQEERLAIAANLKAQGFPLEAIAEATGLPKEQLEAL